MSLVGYDGVRLVPSLEGERKGLAVVRFTVPSPVVIRKVLPIYLVWRILSLCLYLVYALVVSVPRASPKKKVDCLLVQNPPALPLLAVACLYSFAQGILTGTRPRVVIDWHNLGFSMLPNPIFSRLAKIYEKIVSPCADAHLCVTQAMKDFLISDFNIALGQIGVLHDCPPAMFQPLTTKDQHELLGRLHSQLCAVCPKSWYMHLETPKQTLFTEIDTHGNCTPRIGRPALITSSTSWTPDEDFGILLEAALQLDQQISSRGSNLRIVIVVTGKGPQKSYYQEIISKLKLDNVAIQTLWLEPADYPKLLACADLGVSLHTSTSGRDLPMKILDLFGCGVPCLALNFRCLSELIEDDENGRTFDDSAELLENLWYLLRPLGESKSPLAPHSFGELARYSLALKGRKRWDMNWKENAAPILQLP